MSSDVDELEQWVSRIESLARKTITAVEEYCSSLAEAAAPLFRDQVEAYTYAGCVSNMLRILLGYVSVWTIMLIMPLIQRISDEDVRKHYNTRIESVIDEIKRHINNT